MKRILAVGVLAAVVAATAQGQNSGLTAAGSNFTGPGGGGAATSSTIGAYIPKGGFANVRSFNRVLFAYDRATAPRNITVGNVTVSVDAATQKSVADVFFGRISAASFATALPGVPSAQAQALGDAIRGLIGLTDAQLPARLSVAINAFNAAINAMPVGTPVPPAIIAARALISGVYNL